jgi:O-antigen ligase
VPNAARSAVAPLYLFACLILGGSVQGIWQNMILQLAGVAIVAWAAAAPSDEPLPAPAKPLLFLAAVAILLVALQEVPVAPALWAHGSRAPLADGFRLLGQPVPALPASLTPYESLSTLFCLIPPLAMFCAIVRLGAYRPSWLAAALLAGTIAGIMLGALQVASAGQDSPWYLYRETNLGVGVGFFANANHMASLLVIALPFVAAIAAAGKSRNIQRYSALLSILAGVAVVLVVGIALNGSLAGYVLAVPVVAASALIVLPPASRLRHWIAGLAALSVIAAVAGLASSSIGGTKIGQEASTSVQSRQQILATTGMAIADYMPLGSGLGSFTRIYRLYESPDTVTSEYVIHAHNDYAELALEMGVPGVILLLLFLGWWVVAVLGVWRSGEGGPFARAASIASAAVLVHSLVDFPLRTAAISACFAMCLALLADRRATQQQEVNDLRPTRHVVIG